MFYSSSFMLVSSPLPGFQMIQYVCDWTTQRLRQSFSNLQASMVWEKNLWRDEEIHYLEGRESTRVEPRPALPEVTDHPVAPAQHMTSLCMAAKAFTSLSGSSDGFCNTFSCVSVKYDFISGIHLLYMWGPAVGDPRESACFLNDLSGVLAQGAIVQRQRLEII